MALGPRFRARGDSDFRVRGWPGGVGGARVATRGGEWWRLASVVPAVGGWRSPGNISAVCFWAAAGEPFLVADWQILRCDSC
jgi:hypothetical protein